MAFALTRGALVITFAFFGLSAQQACDCGEVLNPIPEPPPVCSATEPCGAGTVRRFGECVEDSCETDGDCCPGHRCREDFGICWPKQFDNDCDTDDDCDDPAQRCLETVIGDRDPVLTCSYERCDGDADCGEGRTCFSSVCVKDAPCGGGCADGEVCDVITGTCAPVGPGAQGCTGTCDGLLVLQDPDGMSGEMCCPALCQCKALPPIVPTRFGRYAAIAKTPNEVLVSAYDAEYGDAVLVHYAKVGGQITRVDYVDGVPAAGEVRALATGPRGGVTEPGPNVGTHTGIGTNAQGHARIAYHDVDNKSLKVAIQQTNGTFETYTLDTPTEGGTVGVFNEVTVNPPTGEIAIAYLVHNVTGLPGVAGPGSALKVARSRVGTPASQADWDFYVIDARAKVDPCDGTCAGNQVCVLDGDVACRNIAATCPDTCSEKETCVILSAPDPDGNTTGCAGPPLPTAHPGFPRARGLHPSIRYDSVDLVMAYYDSIDGDLYAAKLTAGGNIETHLVSGDGQSGREDGDIGRFPSIDRRGADYVIVYTDFSRHKLKAWQGQLGAAGTVQVVDVGSVPGVPGSRFVGAGAKALIAGNEVVVAYQDASTLDLKFAASNGAAWTPEVLLDEGAQGFYTDMVIDDGAAYVISVKAELDARGIERPRLTLLSRNVP